MAGAGAAVLAPARRLRRRRGWPGAGGRADRHHRAHRPGQHRPEGQVGRRRPSAPSFDRYVELTARPARGRTPDIVIWPEGALPAVGRRAVRARAPGPARPSPDAMQPGQTLLMGTYRGVVRPDGRDVNYYNSLVGLPPRAGRAAARRGSTTSTGWCRSASSCRWTTCWTASGVRRPDPCRRRTSAPARGRARSTCPALPAVQPLICYEGLFPGLHAGGAGRPAGVDRQCLQRRLVRPHLGPAAAPEPAPATAPSRRACRWCGPRRPGSRR